MKVTIDSCVFVSYFLKTETNSQKAEALLKPLFSGEARAIMPNTVLVEVVAAIRRVTSSEENAIRVMRLLKNTPGLEFVPIDDKRSARCALFASRHSLRGMDSIVAQVHKEYNTLLITFDKEFEEKLLL